jgi:hypothetical protein
MLALQGGVMLRDDAYAQMRVFGGSGFWLLVTVCPVPCKFPILALPIRRLPRDDAETRGPPHRWVRVPTSDSCPAHTLDFEMLTLPLRGDLRDD